MGGRIIREYLGMFRYVPLTALIDTPMGRSKERVGYTLAKYARL